LKIELLDDGSHIQYIHINRVIISIKFFAYGRMKDGTFHEPTPVVAVVAELCAAQAAVMAVAKPSSDTTWLCTKCKALAILIASRCLQSTALSGVDFTS
jgi:hypothetical protein